MSNHKYLKPFKINEAYDLIGPFSISDKKSDAELLKMYKEAVSGYAYWTKGWQYPKSDYKEAYTKIEKILKKRKVKIPDSMNESKAWKEAEQSGELQPLLDRYKRFQKYDHGELRYGSFRDLIRFGKSYNFDKDDWEKLGKVTGAGPKAFNPKYIKESEELNEAKSFFRLSKKTIDDAFGLDRNLSSILGAVQKGGDLNYKGLKEIHDKIGSILADAKEFKSKDEVVGTLYEAKSVKVDKNMWNDWGKTDAGYDKRMDALLSVFKDPWNAQQHVEDKWEDLPGEASHMKVYENLNEAKAKYKLETGNVYKTPMGDIITITSGVDQGERLTYTIFHPKTGETTKEWNHYKKMVANPGKWDILNESKVNESSSIKIPGFREITDYDLGEWLFDGDVGYLRMNSKSSIQKMYAKNPDNLHKLIYKAIEEATGKKLKITPEVKDFVEHYAAGIIKSNNF